MTMPALALECANSGTPVAEPDDTGDANATACGGGAVASGTSSTALGLTASSAGNTSTALGFAASSAGPNSAALGTSASSVGDSSTAVGRSAISTGVSSTALGYFADSDGPESIALGYQADSVGNSSVALGRFASSDGEFSIALGGNASAAGSSSTAIGDNASAAGSFSIAMGLLASSAGNNSTALGGSASSFGIFSTALGAGAFAGGALSTAVGYLAFADQPETVILGSIAGKNDAGTYAKVGIGTSNPLEAVDVERSAAAARFQLTSFTDTGSEAPQFIQRRARGTTEAPTAVQNNDNLGLFSFRGYNGTVMGGSRATITAQAAGTFTETSTPTRLIFSTTPVGSTAPQSVLVITPDGKVQVKGVNLNVPDYVFEDDYELMPLEELRSFIDANGHLPGIASAQQVKDEGLDLAGSQMSQLQKIEELTLYTLQQQERIAELEALQERVALLETMLNRALTVLD